MTSTPTKPVDNVVIATKGLQDRNTNIIAGRTVENKGKLIRLKSFIGTFSFIEVNNFSSSFYFWVMNGAKHILFFPYCLYSLWITPSVDLISLVVLFICLPFFKMLLSKIIHRLPFSLLSWTFTSSFCFSFQSFVIMNKYFHYFSCFLFYLYFSTDLKWTILINVYIIFNSDVLNLVIYEHKIMALNMCLYI